MPTKREKHPKTRISCCNGQIAEDYGTDGYYWSDTSSLFADALQWAVYVNSESKSVLYYLSKGVAFEYARQWSSLEINFLRLHMKTR